MYCQLESLRGLLVNFSFTMSAVCAEFYTAKLVKVPKLNKLMERRNEACLYCIASLSNFAFQFFFSFWWEGRQP